MVFLSKRIPISRGCYSRTEQFFSKDSVGPRELGFRTQADFFLRKWAKFLNLEVMRGEEELPG